MSTISKEEYLDQYVFGSIELPEKERLVLIHLIMFGPIRFDLCGCLERVQDLFAGSITLDESRRIILNLSNNGYASYYECEIRGVSYLSPTFSDAIASGDVVEWNQ